MHGEEGEGNRDRGEGRIEKMEEIEKTVKRLRRSKRRGSLSFGEKEKARGKRKK